MRSWGRCLIMSAFNCFVVRFLRSNNEINLMNRASTRPETHKTTISIAPLSLRTNTDKDNRTLQITRLLCVGTINYYRFDNEKMKQSDWTRYCLFSVLHGKQKMQDQRPSAFLCSLEPLELSLNKYADNRCTKNVYSLVIMRQNHCMSTHYSDIKSDVIAPETTRHTATDNQG